VVESNHHHTVIFDRYGNYPEFMERYHQLVARSQNALRGRWENFWSSEEPCAVVLVDRADVIARIIYAAANPVKDRLVDKAHHWPGINGYTNLMSGRPLRATRPRHFFRESGPMPKQVSLELSIPSELGPREDVLPEVRAGVEAIEQALAAEIRAGRTRVVGVGLIRRQSWKASPATVEPRRNLRPRFAARDEASRIAVLLGYRTFLAAYRDAHLRRAKGQPAVFPYGTYGLRRFGGVAIGPPLAG
jgi:hypothetical protein